MDDRSRMERPLAMPPHLAGLMNLSQNQPMAPSEEGLTFQDMLHAWADQEMAPGEVESFHTDFTQEKLLAASAAGEKSISFSWQDPDQETLEKKLTVRFLQDPLSEETLCVCSLSEMELRESGQNEVQAEKAEGLLQSISQSYDAVCVFSLTRGRISAGSIRHDRALFFPVHEAESTEYDTWLKQCSNSRVLGPWQAEYESRFSRENLLRESEKENAMVSSVFESSLGTLRQDAFFYRTEENVQCMIGVLNLQAQGSGAMLSLQTVPGGGERGLTDLEMEMSFERKEMKSKSRRKSILCFLLALVIGLCGSPLLDTFVPFNQTLKDAVFGVEAPEEEEVPEEPTEVEETAAETVVTYIGRDHSLTFTAETYESGTSRTVASDADYDSETLTMTIGDVLTPDYYAGKYKKYVLDGTEAGVSFTLNFARDDDADITLIPQNAFQIYLAGEEDQRTEDYQLMDKEIAGEYNVSLKDGQKKTFYKRYPYDETMAYLVVIYYEDGVRHEARFALRYDDPNVDHEEMKLKDRGIMVQVLKQKLLDLGYEIDKVNQYFDATTEAAVRAAQADLGLDETGVADTEFLKKLFSLSAKKETT